MSGKDLSLTLKMTEEGALIMAVRALKRTKEKCVFSAPHAPPNGGAEEI